MRSAGKEAVLRGKLPFVVLKETASDSKDQLCFCVDVKPLLGWRGFFSRTDAFFRLDGFGFLRFLSSEAGAFLPDMVDYRIKDQANIFRKCVI